MRKDIILTVFVSMLLPSMIGMQFAAPVRAATTETAMIDLYTQKGGKGPNMPGGSFMREEKVILYANVTNNNKPMSDKIVGFEVHGPPNRLKNVTLVRTNMTNASGMTTINFRIPWPDENPETIVLGIWIAYACVGIYGKKVEDTLNFTVHSSTNTVGGIWIKPNKFQLLAPYIGLASTILVATAVTAIYLKRRKEKQ